MTDAEADIADMRALQAGESAALDRLMARWQLRLRAYLLRHTVVDADALDLAQETFVRVYLQRDRFDLSRRFSTWLFQIALNLLRDHARRLGRRPTTPWETVPEPHHDHTPDQDAEQAEIAAAVREAVAELPAPLREVVVLFEYEHHSHAEIAIIVGASAKAVETRLYRAREQLRQRLGRWLQRA